MIKLDRINKGIIILLLTVSIASAAGTDDLIESIRQVKLTPEGCEQGLLRDVAEVFISISQDGPVKLPEQALHEKVEEALRDVGVGVVATLNLSPGSHMPPVLTLSIQTAAYGPVVSYHLYWSVMDWMRPISAPQEYVYCPSYYTSTFGFSHVSNAQNVLTYQVQSSLKLICQEWQRSRASNGAIAATDSPSYITLTEAHLEQFVTGADEVVRRAILTNLDEMVVSVELHGDETSVLIANEVKNDIISRLNTLGIKHVELKQGLEQWEETGRIRPSLSLIVRTTDNGQGYSGLSVKLAVHETMVRASVPDFALTCPVYTEGFFGADTSAQLMIELSDRIDETVEKFVKELQLAKRTYSKTTGHSEVLLPSQTQEPDVETPLTSESQPVMTLEPAYQSDLGPVKYYIVSPNGQRFACAVEQNGKWHVVLDGKTYGPYDKILNPTNPYAPGLFWSFSSDSKHFAVCLRHEGHDYLFVDGDMGPRCTEIDAGKFDYSPQNESFACEAKQDGRWGWLVRKSNQAKFYTKQVGDDGVPAGGGAQLFGMRVPGTQGRNQLLGAYQTRSEPHDPYFSIKTEDRLFLSGDHQHTYYFKPVPGQGRGIVVDGQFAGPYNGIRSFWYTRDGHYAYIGSLKKSNPRDPRSNECVVDGKVVAGSVIKDTGFESICLSPDGKRYAYLSKSKGEGYVTCDGREFGPFEARYPIYYGFGPNGKHFWISASPKPYQSCFIYDGQEQSYVPYPSSSLPIFSPDGTRAAFCSLPPDYEEKRINPQKGYVMVVDGKPSSVYASVGTPVFSPDSEHVAFWASKGSHRSIDNFIVSDNQEIAVGPRTILDSNLMLFSPNSHDLWYCSTGSDSWLMRNDQSVCRYEHMPLGLCNFTGDGRHLVFSSDLSPDNLWIDGFRIPCPTGSFRMPHGLGRQIALPQTNKDTVSMFVYASDNLFKATIDLTRLAE